MAECKPDDGWEDVKQVQSDVRAVIPMLEAYVARLEARDDLNDWARASWWWQWRLRRFLRRAARDV